MPSIGAARQAVGKHGERRDEMRENGLQAIWEKGATALVGQCSIASSLAAETMAHAGYDAVLLDMQHSPIDYAAMLHMAQAVSTTDAVPMVRIPWNEPAYVMQAFDAGAYAVICPMINNRADCAKFVGASKYAPEGYRSFGPVRGFLYGGKDYAERANDTLIPIAMIETEEAVQNAEEIVATKGLGGIYIGPADLSISLGLGLPRGDAEHPRLMDAIMRVRDVCRKHGVPVGLYTATAPFARKMAGEGFAFAVLGIDLFMIGPAAAALVADFRGEKG